MRSVRAFLVYEALLLLEVDETLFFAILLQRLLRGVGFLLLLLQPVSEPARGLGGGGEAEFQGLLDVELGQGVHGLGRERRLIGGEAQVDETAARHRLDRDPRPEGGHRRREKHAVAVEGRCGRLSEDAPLDALPRRHQGTSLEFDALLETQPLDDLLCQHPPAQKLVLCLVIVRPRLHHVHQFLVGEEVGRVAVDENLGGGLVDRARGVVVDDGDDHAQGEAGDQDPTALVHHGQVTPSVLQHDLLVHSTPLVQKIPTVVYPRSRLFARVSRRPLPLPGEI
jgi:hypothetical protein